MIVRESVSIFGFKRGYELTLYLSRFTLPFCELRPSLNEPRDEFSFNLLILNASIFKKA